MTRRNIIILSIIYVIIVAGLFWLTYNPRVQAAMVTVEVVQPSPVVDTYSDGIPGTYNPQRTVSTGGSYE